MDYPSVTQVLGLVTDFSNIQPYVLDHAAYRGSRVHASCSAYAQNLWVPHLEEEFSGYYQSFTRWFDAMVDEVLFVEREFVDPDLGYKGHPDLGVVLKGTKENAIIDLKTPLAIQKTWGVQLAGYLHLTKKQFQIQKIGSLRLDPNGWTAKINWYEKSEREFAVFLNLLFAYKYFF